ncbi:MAG TPA: flagellar motor protein MotB [Terracidiphilus sp.]|jgi:chemotaxis protein MotB|nr:flagellar motor protein MotB [Terracidiphilus sp.]
MAGKSQPIIVIKKKGGHGGHHGGAWKVAYADFVTAMMSLFIVLWLMGSSQKVKQAVAGYFNDPKGTASLLGTTMTGTGETAVVASNDKLQQLKEKLEAEIKARKDLEKLSKQIEITITPEGLRIELIEDKDGTFYKSGSPQLSAKGQELLTLLAGELKTLPNSLMIEGHTDATQYSTDANYSNWELSADRANAARRLLQHSGVRSDQVTQVRGYADQLLRVKNNPYDPSNRRISILVKNVKDGAPPPNIPNATVVGGTPAAATAKATPSDGKRPTIPPTAALTGNPEAGLPPPIKPSAGTPAPKPGLMSRMMGMLPGKKK